MSDFSMDLQLLMKNNSKKFNNKFQSIKIKFMNKKFKINKKMEIKVILKGLLLLNVNSNKQTVNKRVF